MKKLFLILIVLFTIGNLSFAQVRAKVVIGNERPVYHRHYVPQRHYYVRHHYYRHGHYYRDDSYYAHRNRYHRRYTQESRVVIKL